MILILQPDPARGALAPAELRDPLGQACCVAIAFESRGSQKFSQKL
ncbi:MAG: hypothetical protein JO323_02670 [Acidobacteriia bacterium]|nr:hypothetical protein [Terriglobia bacterium]